MDSKSYSDYQIKLWRECYDDALQIAVSHDVSATEQILIANALFDKRCSPEFYFKHGADT